MNTQPFGFAEDREARFANRTNWLLSPPVLENGFGGKKGSTRWNQIVCMEAAQVRHVCHVYLGETAHTTYTMKDTLNKPTAPLVSLVSSSSMHTCAECLLPILHLEILCRTVNVISRTGIENH